MTTRELLELAQIDALGLLDDQERDDFDRAVLAATPAVQAQVRAAQDRFVKTPWMPEPVEPPSSLRDAVLSDIGAETMKPRVMAAIREEIRKSTREIAIKAVEPARHDAGRRVPEINRVTRVSPLWRAAALGLMGVAVVFGYTTLNVFERVEEMDAIARNERQVAPMIQYPGLPLFDVLFDENTKLVMMRPATGELEARATVIVAPDGAKARLFCNNMKPVDGMEYRVVSTNEAGKSEVVARFDAVTGSLKGQELALTPSECAKLAIVLAPKNSADSVAGRTILTAGPLLG